MNRLPLLLSARVEESGSPTCEKQGFADPRPFLENMACELLPEGKRSRQTAPPACVEVHTFELEPTVAPCVVTSAVLMTLGRFAGVEAPASLEDLLAFRRRPEVVKSFNLRSRFGSYWTGSGFGLPHGVASPKVAEALQAWLADTRAASSSALLGGGNFELASNAGKLIVKPPGGAKLDVHTDQVSPEGLRRYLEAARPTLQEAARKLGVQAVFGLEGPAATEVLTNITPQRLWWLSACCCPEFAARLNLRVAPTYYATWGGKAAGQGGQDLFRGGRLHPAVARVMDALETGAEDPEADAVRRQCSSAFLEWLRRDDRAGVRLPAPTVVRAGGPGELLLMLHGVPHAAASVKSGRLAGTAKFWAARSDDDRRIDDVEGDVAGGPKHKTWSIPAARQTAFRAIWDEAQNIIHHDDRV